MEVYLREDDLVLAPRIEGGENTVVDNCTWVAGDNKVDTCSGIC